MSSVEKRLTALGNDVAALTNDVTALRERVADTHTLAAHADRDVAEFRDEMRAQTRLIGLTRLDLADVRGEMAGLREEMMTKADKSDVAGLKADVAELKAGIGHIVDLLEQLGGGETTAAP